MELLVTLVVIALLVALLLGAGTAAWRSSRRAAQRLDFQTLAAAINAYREDFRDYPRNPLLNDSSLVSPDVARPLTTCLFNGAHAYLRPGTFSLSAKVRTNWSGAYYVGQEVQDRWGHGIQYYTRFHPYCLRKTTAMAFAPAAVAGPLLGMCDDAATHLHSIWDLRDGDLTLTISGSNVLPASDQGLALLYRLGDVDGSNAIEAGETAVDVPYFLLSAGPDGTFTSFKGKTPGQYAATDAKSDDIYSFDDR